MPSGVFLWPDRIVFLRRFKLGKGNHVTDIEPYADPFADGVVMMRWHQRQYLQAIAEFQRVQKVGAAKQFADHACLEWRGIVVQDIVGAQQDIETGLCVIITKAGGGNIMNIAERS